MDHLARRPLEAEPEESLARDRVQPGSSGATIIRIAAGCRAKHAAHGVVRQCSPVSQASGRDRPTTTSPDGVRWQPLPGRSAVQTSLGRRSGSRNIRSSNSGPRRVERHVGVPAADRLGIGDRRTTTPATPAPAVSSASTSARASVKASESGQSANAGRVGSPRCRIRGRPRWTSSVSSPRPPSGRSRIPTVRPSTNRRADRRPAAEKTRCIRRVPGDAQRAVRRRTRRPTPRNRGQ